MLHVLIGEEEFFRRSVARVRAMSSARNNLHTYAAFRSCRLRCGRTHAGFRAGILS